MLEILIGPGTVAVEREGEAVNTQPSHERPSIRSGASPFRRYRERGPPMRAVVTRVTEASVTVEDEIVGSIAPGLLVLLGVAREDEDDDARTLAAKVVG